MKLLSSWYCFSWYCSSWYFYCPFWYCSSWYCYSCNCSSWYCYSLNCWAPDTVPPATDTVHPDATPPDTATPGTVPCYRFHPDAVSPATASLDTVSPPGPTTHNTAPPDNATPDTATSAADDCFSSCFIVVLISIFGLLCSPLFIWLSVPYLCMIEYVCVQLCDLCTRLLPTSDTIPTPWTRGRWWWWNSGTSRKPLCLTL